MELMQRNGWSERTRTELRRDTPAKVLREPLAKSTKQALALVAAGCLVTAHYALPNRRAPAYSPAFESARHTSDSAVRALKNDVDVDHLVGALGLSIKGLAELMGVSRPSIYAWRKDGAISPDNLQRLRNLRDATLLMRQARPGRLPTDWATRTLDESGLTFQSGFAAGGSANELALRLIALWQLGDRKRRELDDLLGGMGLEGQSNEGAANFGETFPSR